MESKDIKTITDEEMKQVEAEIAKKQAETLKSKYDEQAKDIEAKVRKEMEIQLESDRLKAKLEEQEKQLNQFKVEQETKMKLQEEAFKKQIEDLVAVKKGISKNESPFAANNPNIRTLSDGTQIDISQLDHEAIEEQSRQAFIQAFGIKDQNFGKAMVRYK